MRLLLLLLAGCAVSKTPVAVVSTPRVMSCGFVGETPEEEAAHQARHAAIDQMHAILRRE